jgi:hypothetical protein
MMEVSKNGMKKQKRGRVRKAGNKKGINSVEQ